MRHITAQRLALALTGAVLAFAGLGVQAQDIKERNLKFATSLAKEHPFTVGMQKLADGVAQKSGGKMKITVFPSAVLGSDQSNLSAARGGTLEMTTMATGLLSGIDKEFMLFDFPFLFNNSQEAFALSDGPVGSRLLNKLPAHGLVGLGIWDLGFRHMTNSKRPIAKLEDVQGLKLRVIASPIYVETFNALGANPVPMTFGEVYGALESKAIDGQDNPAPVIESAKFAEVQKYLTLTRHLFTAMPILISKKTWDTMSPAEQKILQDAASEARAEVRKLSQAKDAQAIDNLRKTMQVNELSTPEVARMREKVKPVVDKFTREVGEPVVAQANAELARMRAK